MSIPNSWERSKTSVFWGEIAPCDHVVQIYEDKGVFLDVLAGFVGDGINSGDSIIVIATDEHLVALNERLKAHGMNIKSLITNNQYIALNAKETLNKFMVNNWPDEVLFMEVIEKLIFRARKNGRNVRAFGEMVAVLWAEGHNGATVQLEHLWNKFCAKEQLCLFCAYPKTGFTQDAHESILNICGTHSKIITAKENSLTEIHYQSTVQRAAS